MVAPLRSQSGLCFDEPDKAKLLLNKFFSGSHLKEEEFDGEFENLVDDQMRYIDFFRIYRQ